MIKPLLILLASVQYSKATNFLNNYKSFYPQQSQKCYEGARFSGQDCSYFYQYNNGKLHRVECPNGYSYWDRIGECTSQYECKKPKCYDGQKDVAVDNDRKIVCNYYALCELNEWHFVECPKGSYYDYFTKECVYGVCGNNTTEPGYGVPTVPTTEDNPVTMYSDWIEEPIQNEQYIAETCQGNVVLPDRRDCRRYWSCNRKGFFVGKMCNQGYVFSWRQQKCIRGKCAENSENVCPQGQFLPTDTCGEYKFCSGNEWKSGFCSQNRVFVNGVCGPQTCQSTYMDDTYVSGAECKHDDIYPAEDRNSYWYCYYGKWSKRHCQQGYEFDYKTYQCIPKRPNPPPPPPICFYGQKKPIEGQPNAYGECDGYGWVIQYCPFGQQYKNGYCVADPQPPTTCVEQPGAANYRKVSHDCTHFYQCAQGRWVKMPCAPGTVWNEAITTCDHERNVPECAKEGKVFEYNV